MIVMASLIYNARLWLQDYPQAIREKVAPLSRVEKRQRAVIAALIMGVLFGGVLLETLQLRNTQAGAIYFGAAYLYIFLMLVTVNIFDMRWCWIRSS